MRFEQGGETSKTNPLLYMLAEQMCKQPDGFDRYNYAKYVWLGNPDREQRLAGDHPWPKRLRGGEEYTFSVPVLAGVDATRQRLLYIGKDDWKPVDDPNAWLVAERGLLTGEEVEHIVMAASVDGARELRLFIAPPSYDNFPPIMRDALRRKPAYDQTILSGRLDGNYHLSIAELRDGIAGHHALFEDVEALESMIRLVQQLPETESGSMDEGLSSLGSRATALAIRQ